MADGSDCGAIFDLALRRCGSKPASFVEVRGADPGLAERIRGGAATVRRHHGAPAPERFADETVDFLFIHDLHDSDLASWWPRLRPGGMVAGGGYDRSADVRRAVDAFVDQRGLGHAFRREGGGWIIHRSISIDAMYCINLAHRTDRRRNAEGQFAAAGLAGRVSFFEAFDGAAIAHPGVVSDGQAGCCLSHLGVLREAVAKGHRHVMIFEDDVLLAPDFANRFAAALARCPASYDLFYAGALCEAGWGNFLYPFDDGVARIGSVYGNHAYVVNLEAFPVIEAGMGDLASILDHWYDRQLHSKSNCYLCTPHLATQGGGFSDIAQAFNNNGWYSNYAWR